MNRLFAIALLWLFTLLTIPCPSWAQVYFERLDALEKEALAAYEGFDVGEFENRFNLLRSEYQKLGKVQEEIWALYAFDFDQEAKRLENELRLRLKTESIVEEEYLPLARSTVRKAKLESGLRVIIREHIADGIGPGVLQDSLVYRLSHALGFHNVPVTVVRPHRNSLISVHPLIRDFKQTSESFLYEPYTDQKLHILDFITGQADRHSGNWFLAPGRRAIAIDNDVIYGSTLYAEARKMVGAKISSDLPPKNLTSEEKKALERLLKVLNEDPASLDISPREATFFRSRVQMALEQRSCSAHLTQPR